MICNLCQTGLQLGMAKRGHNNGKITRVLKDLKKHKAIKAIEPKSKGYMIKAENGEQFLFHVGEKGMHHLRRWLKNNTNIKINV